MPSTGPEFDPVLAYLNERTCHQCRTRFRDDDRFGEHIRAHRDGSGPKTDVYSIIASLMQIREQTGG